MDPKLPNCFITARVDTSVQNFLSCFYGSPLLVLTHVNTPITCYLCRCVESTDSNVKYLRLKMKFDLHETTVSLKCEI